MNTTINTNKGAETSAKTALRYSTAILDAPWPTGQRGTLGAGRHYPLMTIEQIRGLPIPDLMAENAHLYMWCYPATRALAAACTSRSARSAWLARVSPSH